MFRIFGIGGRDRCYIQGPLMETSGGFHIRSYQFSAGFYGNVLPFIRTARNTAISSPQAEQIIKNTNTFIPLIQTKLSSVISWNWNIFALRSLYLSFSFPNNETLWFICPSVCRSSWNWGGWTGHWMWWWRTLHLLSGRVHHLGSWGILWMQRRRWVDWFHFSKCLNMMEGTLHLLSGRVHHLGSWGILWMQRRRCEDWFHHCKMLEYDWKGYYINTVKQY